MMDLDPENPVVKLCVAGMQAEAQGKMQVAHDLFQQAWEQHQDDFEACIAAHFLARQLPDPADILHWNQQAVFFADQVGDERVSGFYPSLYLNLGWSYEQLGALDMARQQYQKAAELVAALPEGPYREVVEKGIQAGTQRVARSEK
jgi:tetratricopeptide (TPR) repeat protein